MSLSESAVYLTKKDNESSYKVILPNIFLQLKIFKDLVIFESRLSEKENIGDGEEREEGDEDEHGAGRKKEAKGR